VLALEETTRKVLEDIEPAAALHLSLVWRHAALYDPTRSLPKDLHDQMERIEGLTRRAGEAVTREKSSSN